jgi:hypothetical protein
VLTADIVCLGSKYSILAILHVDLNDPLTFPRGLAGKQTSCGNHGNILRLQGQQVP